MANRTYRCHPLARLATLTIVAVGLLLPVQVPSVAAQVISEFPTGGNSPFGIVAGSDGALWFTTSSGYYYGYGPVAGSGATIGRMSTTGHVKQYAVPASPSTTPSPPSSSYSAYTTLGAIAAGPDGAIWYAATDYSLYSSSCYYGYYGCGYYGYGSAASGGIGAPGRASGYPPSSGTGYCYCDYPTPTSSRIGRVTTAGAFTEFMLPTSDVTVGDITAGPAGDGALWFTESTTGYGATTPTPQMGKIARISTAGAVTEFAIPKPNTLPGQIVAGSDGALWFTELVTDASAPVAKIGRMTTSGGFTEFAVPTPDATIGDMTLGSDGALWFTETVFPSSPGYYTTYSTPAASTPT